MNPSEPLLGDVFGRAAAAKKDETPAPPLAGRLGPLAAASQPSPVAAPPAIPLARPAAPPVAPPVALASAQALTSEDGTKQISIYVLPHVPEAIRAAKRGRTNAAVVYDAIEGCLPQLPGLLAARRTAPASGGLFTRQATDSQAETTRIPWTFKVTPANRAVLDSLVTRCGATSRSELVAAALEYTYPVPDPDAAG
jgi:hypothetical protein